MVGTGRFELPTPRTPSECSTRLSHVPTQSSRPGRAGFWGSRSSLHQLARDVRAAETPELPGFPGPDSRDLSGGSGHTATASLVRGRHVLAGQSRSAAEEELLHLLDEELLGLG